MGDHGDGPAAAHERRDRSPGCLGERDRTAVRVDEQVAVERVGELERRVAERARQCLLKLAHRGRVAQFDHEPCDARARLPLAHPRPRDPDREQGERRRLPEPQVVVDGVVGEEAARDAVRVVGGDQREIGGGRQQHRRAQPPGGGGGAGHLDERQHRQRGRPHEAEDQARAAGRLDDVRGARDGEQVVGAVDAALRAGVEGQRGQQTQREQRAGVGEREPGAREPARHAPFGIRERRVRDDRGARRVAEQAEREQQRRAGAGVVELGHEPGAACSREQRPEAARRPPRPGDDAARDQRPADRCECDGRAGRRAGER